MAEKPIMLESESIQAFLTGKKTTMRLIAFPAKELMALPCTRYPDGWWFRGNIYPNKESMLATIDSCRYKAGDIFYIQEPWARISDWADVDPAVGLPDGYIYKADWDYYAPKDIRSDPPDWRPASRMPEEAVRIFLRVTDVRLERLQDITEEDAIREGYERYILHDDSGSDVVDVTPALVGFHEAWQKRFHRCHQVNFGWDANPWVWRIEFVKTERNVGDYEDKE